MKQYNPKEIEPKWQSVWAETGIYKAIDFDERPKYVMLTEFPYPSGDGLHSGHAREYTIGDVMARYKRMQGYNVLYPMGYDAFGLPTENYAIKTGVSPQQATATNVANFRKQFDSLGLGFDWDRQVNTTDPDYYKWTQWLFLQFYKAGLAYQKEMAINWCPKCKTGLANEEVVNGRHERCGTLVEKKMLNQWMLAITKYADRLIDGLKDLDYPDRISSQQINWIGRSEGAEIDFSITSLNQTQEVARSYIMGQKAITKEDIESLGGKVESVTEAGHLEVSFPVSSKTEYEQLITEKMEPGFWNEYIAGEVVFIFKHKNGDIERIILNSQTDEHIRELGQQFNGQPSTVESSWSWLVNNKWYSTLFPEVTVYTTRPDTLAGATFMVLAPEHPAVQSITTTEQKSKVESYIKAAQAQSDIARTDESREKTGVFTGAHAINPLTGKEIPVYIADYVLMGYGTGAIMAVPAHDQRDHEFAVKYQIPIVQVIAPEYIDDINPPKANEELIERTVVQVVVKHPTENKILILDMPENNDAKYSFVTGGVDEGEEPIESAIREVQEETGYKNVKQASLLGNDYFGRFFHVGKQVNRRAHFINVLVELADLEQDTVSEEEAVKHTPRWILIDEADEYMLWHTTKRILEQIRGNVMAVTDAGLLINSGEFDGLESVEAKAKIVEFLEAQGVARKAVKYRLRDWIFSRQHYWGEPIPIIHCDACGIAPVPEDQLPVVLPSVESYEVGPNGESPLAQVDEWVNVDCPQCGAAAKRETDTMPNWAGSSWYYLRYYDAHNDQAFADPEKLKYWGAVDMYLGGMEHTTLHLLYSRFWHQFFYDQKLVPTPEPYLARRGQGIVLAADGRKMSKSIGNVINPTDVIAKTGADALRLYILFMAPYDESTAWSDEHLAGVSRFLYRAWDLLQKPVQESADSLEVDRVVHKSIKKVTEHLDKMRFNTAVSTLMEMVNSLAKLQALTPTVARQVTLLLAPFAPHMAEEAWQQLGEKESVHIASWPVYDSDLVSDDVVEVAIQVNGKLRGTMVVTVDASRQELEMAAQKVESVARHLEDREIIKTIVVPGKMVSFVVK